MFHRHHKSGDLWEAISGLTTVLMQRLNDLFRLDREVGDAYISGISDSVCHGCECRGNRWLTDTLCPKWAVGCGHFNDYGLNRGKVCGSRDAVIDEAPDSHSRSRRTASLP